MGYWNNKKILITGVCGTVGQELLKQIILLEPEEITGIDNNETDLFFLSVRYETHKNVHFNLCDMRNFDHLKRKLHHIDIVIHTAALKHVPICEKAPCEAIATNIYAVQNLINAAIETNVTRVINTSTDKAVNPTNVMGTSKLMGERLITAANAFGREGHTIFSSTRFGNILGSNGSVIPIFINQIKAGGPVTVTDPNMTRFIMSLEEAASLVMNSVFLAQGGEVFVTKMKALRIIDLAKVMINTLAPQFGFAPEDIKLDIIGTRPGEKLYEELVNAEEIRRTLELENYFVVTPAFKSLYRNIEYCYPGLLIENTINESYDSRHQPYLSEKEIKSYLLNNDLIKLNVPSKEKKEGVVSCEY